MSENNISKGIRIASNIAVIFFAVLAVAWTALFILTSAGKFIVFAVICIIALIYTASIKKSPNVRVSAFIGCMTVVTAFTLVILSMPSLTINSNAKWKYPFQRFYVGCYQNVREPEWFPDFLDDVQSDYSFSYMPSIMQGSGFYRVYFVTSPERALEYENKFSAQALYTLSVSEFKSGSTYTVHDENGDQKGDIYITIPEAFGESGTIYVINTNLDWNHHHSSAVIVDQKSGKIGLIQEG